MKSRMFLLRCAAFFLMLIFFQKAGAGLFYHNLFHETASESSAASEKKIGYSCICLDDFLLPFEGTEQVELSVPFVNYILLTERFNHNLSFHTPVFSPLRGPPAAING